MDVECGWQRTLVISCPSGGGRRGRPLYGNCAGPARKAQGGLARKRWTGVGSSLPEPQLQSRNRGFRGKVPDVPYLLTSLAEKGHMVSGVQVAFVPG